MQEVGKQWTIQAKKLITDMVCQFHQSDTQLHPIQVATVKIIDLFNNFLQKIFTCFFVNSVNNVIFHIKFIN